MSLGKKCSLHKPLKDIPEYKIYIGMIERCYVPNRENYCNYGERGIKVCDRWLESFKNFYEDMGERPSINHSLDRIENDGDYSPDNCRWATAKQQARNQSTNRIIEAFGKSQCMAEWAEEYGIKYSTLTQRLKKGWCVTKALLTPTKGNKYKKSNSKLITLFGKTQTIQMWADEFGINRGLLDTRLRNGWCVTKAVLLPTDTYRGKKIPKHIKDQILVYKNSGISQRKVAEKFGISHSSVKNIWREND